MQIASLFKGLKSEVLVSVKRLKARGYYYGKQGSVFVCFAVTQIRHQRPIQINAAELSNIALIKAWLGTHEREICIS